jgi:hypothetical protein
MLTNLHKKLIEAVDSIAKKNPDASEAETDKVNKDQLNPEKDSQKLGEEQEDKDLEEGSKKKIDPRKLSKGDVVDITYPGTPKGGPGKMMRAINAKIVSANMHGNLKVEFIDPKNPHKIIRKSVQEISVWINESCSNDVSGQKKKATAGSSEERAAEGMAEEKDEDVDEETDFRKFNKKQYDKNEDNNNHLRNAFELARKFGTSAEVQKGKKLLDQLEKKGYASNEVTKFEKEMNQKYYKKLTESLDKDEDDDHPIDEEIKENVQLNPTEVPGEYEIRGATTNRFLGKVAQTNFGTVVLGVGDIPIPGIPRISRDLTLDDIKKALDIQFLHESSELNNWKAEITMLSDDVLKSMYDSLTFKDTALTEDNSNDDKSKLSMLKDILVDRHILQADSESA